MACGSHARKQPRNARGQFAPKREVIDLVSDESNESEKSDEGNAESYLTSMEVFEKRMKADLEFGAYEAIKKIKKGVLLPLGHTEIGDSVDKMRAVFDKAKGQARGMVISEATKTCNRIDELFESLFSDAKFYVKAEEDKKKKTTK